MNTIEKEPTSGFDSFIAWLESGEVIIPGLDEEGVKSLIPLLQESMSIVPKVEEKKALEKDVERLTKEIGDAEKKRDDLIDLVGGGNENKQGSLNAKKDELDGIIAGLKKEIGDLEKEGSLEYTKAQLNKCIGDPEKEGSLKYQQFKLEAEVKKRKEEIAQELKTATEKLQKDNDKEVAKLDASLSAKKAEVNKEVKTIETFKDFILETNKNMWLYGACISIAICVFAVGVSFVFYNFSVSITQFFDAIKHVDGAVQPLSSLLDFAFGLVIVKLPFALFLGAVVAAIYQLISSMLTVYEKINKEKRNASAIYAIMNAMSTESAAIVAGKVQWGKDEDPKTAKEKIKWDEISNYFSSLNSKTSDHDDSEKTKDVKSIKLSIPLLEEVANIFKKFIPSEKNE